MAAPRNRPIVEELEARVLYSADLAPGFAAGALPAETRLLDDSADRLAPSAQSEAQVRLELVVVDARVDDADTLLTGLDTALGRRFEVIRLAAGEDGIARVGEALREREALAAVHFIAHGEAGRLQLGATWLDDQSLAARAGEIAAWGDALGSDADILVYGCDVGASETGRAFVERLAALTRADVAASDDLTGNSALGGDWRLEYQTGVIDSAWAPDNARLVAWQGVLGDQFQVNTTTNDDQTTAALNRGSQQAVAYDAAGNFVVVWTSINQDGDGDGVYARRFDSTGVALTGEIQVNSTTSDDQNGARVASEADGKFIVTWTSMNQDGNAEGVYWRRFDASGIAQTAETRANTTTAGPQRNSVIALNEAAGQFVLAWEGQGSGANYDIFYRRYQLSTGASLDATARAANATDAGAEADPTAAMDSTGRFVIAWEDADNRVYAQRFSGGTGDMNGTLIQVGVAGANSTGAAIAMDGSGNFTLVYRGVSIVSGIWAKGFNADDGSNLYSGLHTVLGWLAVDIAGGNDAASPSIAMAPDGTFVVTYQKTGVDGTEIFARRYFADGQANGAAFKVNSYDANDQEAPSIARSGSGDYVVVWSGGVAVSDPKGVAARIMSSTAPVITSNGGGATASINVAENAAAVTTVTASDADLPAQTLTYAIVGGADQALFSIDASTGVLSFASAPDYETPTDAGADNVYDVIVQASDGTLNDTQAIAVTVTPVNDNTPVITSNGGGATASINVAENAAAVTTVTASDADLPAQTLTYAIVGGADQALFSIDASTGVLSFASAPDYETPTDAGADNVYDVIVQASDGTLNDTQAIAVTVTPVNDNTPVITSNGGGATASINVAENAAAVTTVTASDADLPAQTLTYAIVGGADQALFSIDASTGVLSFASAPDYETPTDAGADNVYDVIVQASDGTLNDTQAIAVTVTPVNDNTPVITSNGGGATASINVAENAAAVTTVTASDADLPAQTLTYAIVGGADQALFSIDASTGVLSFASAPDYETPTDAGADNVYDVIVQASDGTLNDTQAIAVTVTPVNDNTPVITSNGGGATASINVAENAAAVTTVTASDADLPAQTLTYAISGGADAARFTINASTGVLSFVTAPDYEAPTDVGGNNVYDVTVQVSDGTGGTGSQSIAVTVTPVNDNAPILGPIGAQTIAEGALLSFTASATDADLPAQSLSYSLAGAPAGATINATTGAFSWTPTEAQGPGSYSFDILVSDGTATDSETITVTVTEVNDAPILGAIGNQTIAEGSPLSFTATATDADLPAQSLSYSLAGAPAGATINATTGAFSWTPTEAQGPGSYSFDILVSDGTATDSETITVTVTEVNDAPILGPIGNQTIAEGSPLSFTATATDADLPAQSLSFSLAGAPAGATINATTGAFSWTPTEAQGPGSYSFDILVSDGTATDSETITVTVTEVNDAPILAAIGNQTIAEGALLSFTATATDADLPAQSLSYSLAGAPAGATINATTGAFSWTPTEAQGPGSYSFDILVSDGTLTDSETITVTVTEVNDAPILGPIGAQTIAEGALLTFTASATDADLPAQSLSYSLAGAPAGATINATTGAFSWTPTEAQGPGSYSFDILVSDGTATDSETITVTVTEVNDAPILGPIGAQTIAEGALLSFTASATDADLPAQSLSYSLAGAPAGATINATTGAFSWTPTEAQGPGSYSFDILVSDGTATDSETITVTVTEVNDAPILGPIGNQTIAEGSPLSFTSSATDADLPAQSLSYSLDAASLALGMTIDSSTGAVSWTPSESQGGTAPVVTLTVTDSLGLTDSETFSITVGENNLAPILAAIGNRTVASGSTLSVTASATDADLPAQSLSYSLDAASLALGMTIDSSTGAVTWTPSESQGGTAPVVTLTVTDSGGLTDSEAFRIIVTGSSTPDAGVPAPDPVPDPDPAPNPVPDPAPNPGPVKPPSITKPGNIQVPADVTRPAALEDSLGFSRLILPDSVREGISTASGMSRPGFQFVSNAPGPLVATSWVSQGFSLSLLETLQVQAMEGVRQGIGSTGFTDALDRMRNEIQARKEFENIVIGSSVAMSGGLSIGYVLWLLRGGALLGSLLSALPAWAALDPMPVLAYYLGRGRDDDDDDDFSERMFEKARKPKPAVASPAVPADVTPDDSTEPT
jgi:PKD repeat protein